MLSSTDIGQLALVFRGKLITAADTDYDQVRALYNGMIDKRPALIARCADVADVIAAVNFGRNHDLLIAIRGGGHNGAGLASCDGGLMIDLSRLKGIRIDPKQRTVRAESGCTQGDVDHAAHAFGLAVPAGIVSTTGIAGLTLGGGLGYLCRAHGLTIDNLLEADVVLADGRLVTASERENADLFWALRGGGGNFGVVTSFLFRAHAVTDVYAGPMFWDIAHAKQIMRAYPIDGAVRRKAADATAWRCRDATWAMVICGVDPDPGKAAALRKWGRDYWKALHRFNPGGAYVNFMMDDEAEGRVQAAYGDNYPRLVEAKRKYDPKNLFRRNQNIPPQA